MVTDVVKEGWYEDPAGRHQYRWFSAGTPTDLVRDGTGTSRDPLSITDPSVYQTMTLGRPPDDGPLLRPAQPEHAQPFLDRYAVYSSTRAHPIDLQDWQPRRSATEIIAIWLLIFAGIFLPVTGAPPIAWPAPWVLALLIGIAGPRLRRRRARRR